MAEPGTGLSKPCSVDVDAGPTSCTAGPASTGPGGRRIRPESASRAVTRLRECR
jgi:hypothetical protein